MTLLIVIIIAAILIVWLLLRPKKPKERIIQGFTESDYRKKVQELQSKCDTRYVSFELQDNGEFKSIFSFNFENSESKIPHYIVVDTETTGKIKYRNSDRSSLSNWPRIVQISWIVFDKDGKLVKDRTEIFKQPRPIPQDAIDIHGITDEYCKEHGVDPKPVLEELLNDVNTCKYMVAHNAEFDYGVIEANMRRYKVSEDFKCRVRCTMKSTEKVLKLPSSFSGKQYKYPKLSELVNFLFYTDGLHGVTDIHDAETDVSYTSRCYLELKSRGLMK